MSRFVVLRLGVIVFSVNDVYSKYRIPRGDVIGPMPVA